MPDPPSPFNEFLRRAYLSPDLAPLRQEITLTDEPFDLSPVEPRAVAEYRSPLLDMSDFRRAQIDLEIRQQSDVRDSWAYFPAHLLERPPGEYPTAIDVARELDRIKRSVCMAFALPPELVNPPVTTPEEIRRAAERILEIAARQVAPEAEHPTQAPLPTLGPSPLVPLLRHMGNTGFLPPPPILHTIVLQADLDRERMDAYDLAWEYRDWRKSRGLDAVCPMVRFGPCAELEYGGVDYLETRVRAPWSPPTPKQRPSQLRDLSSTLRSTRL